MRSVSLLLVVWSVTSTDWDKLCVNSFGIALREAHTRLFADPATTALIAGALVAVNAVPLLTVTESRTVVVRSVRVGEFVYRVTPHSVWFWNFCSVQRSV